MTAATSSGVDGSTTASAVPCTPRPIRSARYRLCGSTIASAGRRLRRSKLTDRAYPVPGREPELRSHMKLVALAALVAALTASTALAGTPTLTGTVGPGFTITLTKGGKKVTKLKAGTYVFKIADKSGAHNFHLTGPGVNKSTSVGATGNKTWTVKLKKGSYKFVCDPHASFMK